MKYEKPFQSFDQLADLLIEKRGLIADRESLIQHLQDVGYYRLSGYWHIYKKRDSDEFWEGTTFDHVWEMYIFDRQFRLAVLDAVERVEVFMRTQLAHLLARDTSPFGFLDNKNLPRMNNCAYAKFMSKCHGVYARSKSGEPFAKHFAETYGDEHDLPPYWMLVNLMDFGMVVTLYKGSSNAIRQEIASQLGVTTRVLDSWLISLNTVRNICAHHGRLWNRVIGNPPMIPKASPWHVPYEVDSSKAFGVLTVLSYLLEHIAPNTGWRKRLLDMVLALPHRDQERMGFVGEWRECPFWKPYLPESEGIDVDGARAAERDAAWEACRAALGADVNPQAAEQLERWVRCCDESLVGELVELAGDTAAVEDAFYRDLAFGTGGLRGVIGAGTNRMNVHTVAKATQGLADYLNANFSSPSVAIARDSRNMGEEFCRVAAGVLAANGIRAHLYPRIEPTPALSFAVRDLGCSAGICMTASHNPAAYNGYKVYGPDGCQITTQAAREIQAAINAVDVFDDVRRMGFEEALEAGLVSWIGDDTLERFIDGCAAASLGDAGAMGEGGGLKLVYTPLHGAGLECVSKILERIGVTDVTVEPRQAVPDGGFPTCPYPNPEVREALECGLELAQRVQPDLLLATDPDADRVGIAVVKGGRPVLLTGNEVGVLLTDYICRMCAARGEDLRDLVVVTTIVSSAMADALSREHGFELRRTLTGFKFIGEQIGLLEAAGQARRFVFGFEESYGYLAGTHVRDKDAVVVSMLICEMARWYRAQGMDLADAMRALYERYGYYKNGLISVSYPGADGAERMHAITAGLREQQPGEIAGLRVEAFVDYAAGVPMPVVGGRGNAEPQMLGGADVLEFQLEGGNKLMIRPSGTEPKIKAYLFAQAPTEAEADELLAKLDAAARELLG